MFRTLTPTRGNVRDNALRLDSTQHAWLLTYYYTGSRMRHLRQAPPSLIEDTAQGHDNFDLDTLRQLPGTTELDEKTQAQAKLPLRLAG